MVHPSAKVRVCHSDSPVAQAHAPALARSGIIGNVRTVAVVVINENWEIPHLEYRGEAPGPIGREMVLAISGAEFRGQPDVVEETMRQQPFRREAASQAVIIVDVTGRRRLPEDILF